jgi:argininosuccinate lyase
LFDAIDQVALALSGVGGMIATMKLRTDRMASAADDPTASATDLAEWLVQHGTPFRDAHAIVGALVRQVVDHGADLAELVAASEHFDDSAAALVAAGVAVTRRTTRGGGGPGPVADQLRRLRTQLDRDQARTA